ncbi:MAG TPA: family 1 glycosylhydrolase [Pyrinomonadaceae bacterium]|nr:family 1 glycosylhydrolase [Pyrinomonadaceae bacterium]
MRFLSGFESTYIFGSGRDVLELTRHTELVEEDLKLVRSCGLDLLRYSAPWHSVERAEGVYDWRWMDRAMNCMRDLGIAPILDPLHHTSFPEWLEGGFANPNFARAYLKFCTALAGRYPWVRHYTVINEPFVTTWFCGHEGVWYPYYTGANNFVPMILNVVEAISSVSRMLVEKLPDVSLVHVDAAEKHRAHDGESEAHAAFHNEIRFIVPDLVLGKVDESHALYDYLRRHGASKKRLARLRAKPARIDILGLDYYSHCELEWCTKGRVYPNRTPEGLVPTALEYAERYRLPLMLTETNIRGFVQDRISWLKFMVEQCEEIERRIAPLGLAFEGFCWYPFIDSTDWCSLVREANGNVDPQGIFYLDRDCRKRNPSELSEIFTALARGEITSKDIPAYRFQSPLDHHLEAFLPMMAHWNWRDPAAAREAKRKAMLQLNRLEREVRQQRALVKEAAA